MDQMRRHYPATHATKTPGLCNYLTTIHHNNSSLKHKFTFSFTRK